MTPCESQLESELGAAFKPPFTGEIYDYARKLDLQKGYAIRGRFNVNRSRYLIKPMESIRSREVREVCILKGVQSFGSGAGADLPIIYWLENDIGGGILWLFQDDDFAQKYAESRFMPLMKSVPEIMASLEGMGRHSLKTTMVNFPSAGLMIGGLNAGNVQSLSWQRVVVDEGWMSGRSGLIDQAKARTTAFPHTSKFILIGQGGEEGDDASKEWEKSTRAVWGWTCPKCGKLQKHEFNIQRDDGSWAGVKWDTNETTKPDGKWNYDAVAKTARFECFHCRHEVLDTPTNRRMMDDGGDYIVTNPSASSTIHGFHWPTWANVDIPIGGIVQEYLSAKTQAKAFGNQVPLQIFYQKKLAINWNPNVATDVHRIISEVYDAAAEWDGEKFRFLTVDCQRDLAEFWIVAASWGIGEVRELWRGKVETWEQVREKQLEFKIKDQRVFVDAGYEQTKVCAVCADYGHEGIIRGQKMWLCWNALKGMDRLTWPHKVTKMRNGKPVIETEHRVYSPRQMVNPGIGKAGAARARHCPLYFWSNVNVKNTLMRWRDGKAGKFKVLPCEDKFAKDRLSFTSQMNSEPRRIIVNPRTGKPEVVYKQIGDRPNHLWDAWCEQFVAGYIGGCMSDTQPEAE